MSTSPRFMRRRLGILTLSALTLVGCGGVPAGLVGTPPLPDVTWLNAAPASEMAALAAGNAATDRVLVKLRAGRTGQSILSSSFLLSLDGLSATGVYAVPAGSTVAETLATLRQDPNVAYAEPDYRYHATDLHATATVNDPMFNQLWGIQKIQAPTAWDTTMGDGGIVVAVVDTGVDYTHPDLAGQVIKGPDLVNDDADPMDDQGHGSHVAGTIAALANNGVGVVGIAPKTKILAIKVLGSDGSGSTEAIAQGILKANELGAKIINLSLGGPAMSQTLKDAVDTVTAKGTLCVVAAGNDGNSTVNYPAGYPNSLSVGATDQNDKRASFSQYGSTLGIAAPGVGILSTTDGSYKQDSGTSMASPHVAGSAALLLAKYPALTIAQLRAALTHNGDPTTGFGSPAVPRLNVARALASLGPTTAPATGPSAAPAQTPRPASGDSEAPREVTGVKALAASPSSVEVEWNPTTDNVGVSSYRVLRDGAVIATLSSIGYTDHDLAAGSEHRYTVVASDAAGNQSGSSSIADVVTPSSASQLTLSGVALQAVNGTTATLQWNTNLPANSRIDFLPAATYALGVWVNVSQTNLVTAHSLTMPTLLPGTAYYVRLTSKDSAGNPVTVGIYGLTTPR